MLSWRSAWTSIGAAVVVTAGLVARPAAQQRLTAGMVVTASLTAAPGDYQLPSADLDHPAVVVHGSHLTLDFSGVTLRGAPQESAPDGFTGVAVLVEGGEDITIRNLAAHGYKVGLLARHTKGLHVVGGDFSYNWKARLYSLVEHESLLDWLSYHHNEHDEWLEGGAGIYLADSSDARIERTTVVQGQNGLMLVRSDRATVWNSTFSFLSGVGIGLYRASDNKIMHNRIDWCVRGYSEGFYNRGQDSAGILVYEQSDRNVVAFNSVTHDGDGLFLWAGQSTMDTGQGGANDNVFFANDFSYAPTNGIEATFSRNVFFGNRVEECWHGLWGGYSYDSWIAQNRFAQNVEAIAIEHGQDNRITENTFDGDGTAIHLWRNLTQDPNWEYPKQRDTRSRDYDISGNAFAHHKLAFDIRETQNVRIFANTFENVQTIATLSGDTRNLGIGDEVTVPLRRGSPLSVTLPQPLPDGQDPMLPEQGGKRGRRFIIVDEWGPYDWKSPRLWPSGRSDVSPLRLRVLGPTGRWTLDRVRGADISPRSGDVPGEVTVTPHSGAIQDFDVVLAYTGAAITLPDGLDVPAGRRSTFHYARYFVPIDWQLRYFGFDAASAPDRAPDAFERVLAGSPVRAERRNRIDLMSGGPIADGVASDNVAVVAEGDVRLPAGRYRLRTISDEGVRVWIDDERVIDHWTPHESAIDWASLAGGRHKIRLEYYELTGFAELRLEILRE